MRNRPTLTLLLIGILLVQIIPPWSWTEASAHRTFAQQQSRIVGRQELPAERTDTHTESALNVDQVERLQQLADRWAAQQQIDYVRPAGTTESFFGNLFLPLISTNTASSSLPIPVQDDLIELVDLRTANSATYLKADGRLETRVYLTPIHYFAAEQQQWLQYAPSFVAVPQVAATQEQVYQAEGTDLQVQALLPSPVTTSQAVTRPALVAVQQGDVILPP